MTLLKQYVVYVIGFLLLVIVVGGLWAARVNSLRASHLKDAQSWELRYNTLEVDTRAKTAAAKKADEENKVRVDTEQDKVKYNETEIIRYRTTADLDVVRDYIKTHPGSCGDKSLPGASNPAGPTPETSSTTIVPSRDLEICTVNTNSAQGWLDWYLQVRGIPR